MGEGLGPGGAVLLIHLLLLRGIRAMPEVIKLGEYNIKMTHIVS